MAREGHARRRADDGRRGHRRRRAGLGSQPPQSGPHRVPRPVRPLPLDRRGRAGIVGRRHVTLQNRRAFAFADELLGTEGPKVETAGSLWGGKRVFLSIELGHLQISVPGDTSPTDLYLLLTNTHDGSGSVEGAVTPIRSVCQNTVNLALGAAQSKFKVRHSGDLDYKMAQAGEALNITSNYAAEFQRLADSLATKKIVDAQVLDILRTAVFPIDADAVSAEVLADHASTQAFANYLDSATNDSIRGTAWGALNGIVEFIDYGMEYRAGRGGTGRTVEDVRTDSILAGAAQDKKQRALAALLSL